MSAKLDIVTPLEMAERLRQPARDAALESAILADQKLRDAAELLYACDKVCPTVQSRAAIVALRSARTYVERMLHDYNRMASRERITP